MKLMSYQQKPSLLHKQVGDNYFIVNQKKGTLIQLNGVSFFLWQQLNKQLDIDSLVTLLTNNYNVNKEQAKKDIKKFIKSSLKAGVIVKTK